ncbi:MAG: PCP reductase family protein [Pseudomonadales bacterium]|nr:PCP reductase family protein [Pseudomonadales bacterium]
MSDAVEWDQEALDKLDKAPFFVRKMVKGKVEEAARQRGATRVTGELFDELKKQAMGG